MRTLDTKIATEVLQYKHLSNILKNKELMVA